MESNSAADWEESMALTYDEFSTQAIAYAPQLAAAILVLIVGWIVAHALRVVTRKLVRSLDSIFKNSAVTDHASQRKMHRSYAVIISKLVFWMVILFFIAVATNMLGWSLVSNWMAGIGIYIPNLITGLLIILGGFLLANITEKVVVSAALSGGLDHADRLGRLVQLVIIFAALVIGVEQMGIDVSFLTDILIVIVGVLLAGAALAFGFGAKNMVANIIGAQNLRKHCRIGEIMQIGDVEGCIIEVSQTAIVLETDYGRTVVPAKKFQEQVSSFKANDDAGQYEAELVSKSGAQND